MAGFPLIKLGALAIRQISKPLANHLKTKAKDSHFFRTKICMPPAQFYHWCEVKVKSRLLNLGTPKEVVRLNEQAAIDLGSELLGDTFMFTVAAVALVAEYTRQSRKVAEEKANLESRFQQIEAKNSDILVKISSLEETLSKLHNSMSEIKNSLPSKKK